MDGVYDYTWQYLTDTQGSVTAIISGDPGSSGSAALVFIEGATYTPYGSSLHHARSDYSTRCRGGVVSSQ